MKELSIEEKAKRYDEVFSAAKEWYNNPNSSSIGKSYLYAVFPELKESEDERIRKELIKVFSNREKYLIDQSFGGITVSEAIAWLKKQGEQKPADEVKPKFKVGDIVKPKDGGHEPWQIMQVDMFDKKYRFKDGYVIHFSQEDDYELVEQKFTDKVEPKFKVWDWVVNNTTLNSCHIVKVEHGQYICDDCSFPITKENEYHLWTIKDAKDGDVLYECNEKKPFIFKELKTIHIGDIASYCDIFNDIFNPNEDNWTTSDIVPATKEQRDLLFQKMKEAGYEWDVEKKELKKIEQKLAWSEEDCNRISSIKYLLHELDNYNFNNWLDLLKDRVQPQPKQEWSEKDEKMVGNIRSIIEKYAFSQSAVDVNGELCEKEYIEADNWLKSLKERVRPMQEWNDVDKDILFRTIDSLKFLKDTISTDPNYAVNIIDIEREITWLKSLRPQNFWKPNDEQIEILDMVLSNESMDDNVARILRDIREQLKKLREE